MTQHLQSKTRNRLLIVVLLLGVFGTMNLYSQGLDAPNVVLPNHGLNGNQDANLSSSIQTITLNSGTNWVSFNVDITLDDLKAALVAAMPGTQMTITSQTQSTTYNGTRWRGQLNTFDVTMMYKIETVAAGEITLEGLRIDPTTLTININEGNNWIAFPLSEDMSLTDAFAGFAVAGDAIKSNTQSSTYNGTRWRGSLTTLTPGKGYMYVSTVAETRTFTFPTGSGK